MEQENRRIALEEASAQGDNLETAQAVADLKKTEAGAFQAMGVGAQGFAKANETVAQGERDTQDFEEGTDNDRPVPPPAPAGPQAGTSLQGQKPGRKKSASKKAKTK